MITNDFLQNLEKYAPGFSMENFKKHNPNNEKQWKLTIISQILLLMLMILSVACTSNKQEPFVAQKVTCNGSYQSDKFYKFDKIRELQNSGEGFRCKGLITSFGDLDVHHIGEMSCEVRGISKNAKAITMTIPSEWVFRKVLAMNGWKMPTDACDDNCLFTISGGYGASFVQIESMDDELHLLTSAGW